MLSLRIAPTSTCLTVLLDDELIFEAQSDAALVPASLMKIATAAAAFEIMGPDGVYTTEVLHLEDRHGRPPRLREGGRSDPARGCAAQQPPGFPRHTDHEVGSGRRGPGAGRADIAGQHRLTGEAVTFAMMANGQNMNRLVSCNALRRTLLNAAAQYPYGPVPPVILFDASFRLTAG